MMKNMHQINFPEIQTTCAGSQIKLYQKDKLALEFDRLNDIHTNLQKPCLETNSHNAADYRVRFFKVDIVCLLN